MLFSFMYLMNDLAVLFSASNPDSIMYSSSGRLLMIDKIS